MRAITDLQAVRDEAFRTREECTRSRRPRETRLEAADRAVDVPIGRRANRTVIAIFVHPEQRVIKRNGALSPLAHRPQLRNGLACSRDDNSFAALHSSDEAGEPQLSIADADDSAAHGWRTKYSRVDMLVSPLDFRSSFSPESHYVDELRVRREKAAPASMSCRLQASADSVMSIIASTGAELVGASSVAAPRWGRLQAAAGGLGRKQASSRDPIRINYEISVAYRIIMRLSLTESVTGATLLSKPRSWCPNIIRITLQSVAGAGLRDSFVSVDDAGDTGGWGNERCLSGYCW